MLVKELVEKLQKVDQDFEVVVSPEIYVPVLGCGGMQKIADPFTRHGIENIALIRDFDGEMEPMRVVLAIGGPGKAEEAALIG